MKRRNKQPSIKKEQRDCDLCGERSKYYAVWEERPSVARWTVTGIGNSTIYLCDKHKKQVEAHGLPL